MNFEIGEEKKTAAAIDLHMEIVHKKRDKHRLSYSLLNDATFAFERNIDTKEYLI